MDKEKKAIERIKMASEMSLHHYGRPLICTYSGGKDSDVMLEIFKRSGIPFEVHNSHTTADAPQTVRHIRKVFRELELHGIRCEIEKPRYKGKLISMWSLIPEKLIPPTRIVRYCCSTLKETGCANRYIATGVRWDESTSRLKREEFEKLGRTQKEKEKFTKIMLMEDNDARRRMSELCMQQKKMIVNPIIDWTHSDIWGYINSEKIETCELYQCGYDRVGCIGCVMAGKYNYKILEWSDYMQKKFTKSDLKDGMVVEQRDGDMYLVLAGMVVRKRGYNRIGDYDDDLKCAGYTGGDIVKVYRITPESLGCIEDVFIKSNLELIWERTESKKMTVEEMKQKLEELTGEEIEVTA